MIVVKSKHQSNFENDYIFDLILSFSKDYKVVTTEEFLNLDKDTQVRSKILIVYSPGDKKIFSEVDNFIKNISGKYSLIHLSDETLTDPLDHYEDADIILRSYFNPKIKYSNCFTIPVGFQNGYQDSVKHHLEKKYIWSFLGQIYSTRKNMLNNMSYFKPSFLHITEKFMSGKSIPSLEAKKIYKDTIFAPCPFGFINPDTFRVMEVLESGCIPIVKKMLFVDYNKYIFGDHPFIVINDWNKINKTIDYYISNPIELEKKQKEVSEWYEVFKIELSKDIENIFSNNIKNLKSRQFSYQKQKSLNLIRSVIFYYWFDLKKKYYFVKIQKKLKNIKNILKVYKFLFFQKTNFFRNFLLSPENFDFLSGLSKNNNSDLVDLLKNIQNLENSRLNYYSTKPFNSQKKREEIISSILISYKPSTIVETGTFLGSTTEYFSNYCPKVKSVEISQLYYLVSLARLEKYENVELINDESSSFLTKMEFNDEKYFFYLDSHWDEYLPLKAELEQILNLKNFIVCIDDFKVEDEQNWGFDTYGDIELSIDNFKLLKDKPIYFPSYSLSSETGGKKGSIFLSSEGSAEEVLKSQKNLKKYN